MLLQEFNGAIKNEFEVKNYAEAISRDFGLSQRYVYDILNIVKTFKKNQIIDKVPFSYYRILRNKMNDLETMHLFEKEIVRLNKMGRSGNLPGKENYKKELVNIIKTKKFEKVTLDKFV